MFVGLRKLSPTYDLPQSVCVATVASSPSKAHNSPLLWVKKMFLSSLELPDFSKARILVCGDVMLDRYWYGDTSRVSPEAPVPVVHVQNMETRPGGAANVALNIASVGAAITLLGVVGDDPEANDLHHKLSEARVTCALLRVADHPTITKLRVLSQNQQLIRLDFEHKNVHAHANDDLITQFKEQLKHCHTLVLSDYAKGVLSQAPELIALARANHIPVLIDPKLADFSYYRGATLVTPNLKEFEAVVGRCENDEQLVERALALIKAHQFSALLVTRGKQGMILIQEGKEPVNIPTFARDVYDVTGAGDTVIGVLAASLASGSTLEEAAVIANLAAGLVVAKLGAATVSAPELRRAIRNEYSHQGGVLSEAELLQTVLDAKAHGETIVMTNGCFDILHAGHVQYLQQAKNLGCRLIVAVNDDASVRKLKGSTRPLNSLEDRLQVLVALDAVDWVVPFSEDTPQRLIAALLPDILVKGGDYQVNQIAGSKEVLENGGQVIILDFKEGRSTTSLINKIQATVPAEDSGNS